MSENARTALVIDDDCHIVELLTVLLESRGFTVDVLRDGIEAVELQRDYAVILLDLNMPVFDGERLTDYWKLTDPEILKRVIILSGYSRFAQGRLFETFATVQKPFAHGELLRLVEACACQPRNGEHPPEIGHLP